MMKDNRAERKLSFGVLWRKHSLATYGEKDSRYVEMIKSYFANGLPDLAWI